MWKKRGEKLVQLPFPRRLPRQGQMNLAEPLLGKAKEKKGADLRPMTGEQPLRPRWRRMARSSAHAASTTTRCGVSDATSVGWSGLTRRPFWPSMATGGQSEPVEREAEEERRNPQDGSPVRDKRSLAPRPPDIKAGVMPVAGKIGTGDITAGQAGIGAGAGRPAGRVASTMTGSVTGTIHLRMASCRPWMAEW